MPVIAMTQEMGSLAKDVAVQLGEALGLSVLRHEVVEHVADKMNVSRSLISRLREGKAGLVERFTADERSLAIYTAEEVFVQAERGNTVLRGWGATCLLRPVPHVVSVRVTRPLAQRVEWLMADLDTDDVDFATDEIRRSDDAHAARMQERFGVTWGDPLLYDLVLNTERLSVASGVDLIAQLVKRPEFAETEASRALLSNLALQARVNAALRDDEATSGVNVTVQADAGRVKLAGIVLNAEERVQAERVASVVEGVTSVENELRLMASTRRFTSAKYV